MDQIIDQPAEWSKQEDEALIENYARFHDCENPEEQLSLYLASLGFSAKSPLEVKRRIKKYQLQRLTAEEALRRY